MTRPDLDAIEARALAAADGVEVSKPDAGGYAFIFGVDMGYDGEMPIADATLFANARPDLLALVARVRELEAALRAAIDVMEEAPGHSFDEGDGYMCTEADDDVLAGIAAARAALGETP